MLLITKMPTIVGILTFMIKNNSMLNWVKHEKNKYYNIKYDGTNAHVNQGGQTGGLWSLNPKNNAPISQIPEMFSSFLAVSPKSPKVYASSPAPRKQLPVLSNPLKINIPSPQLPETPGPHLDVCCPHSTST